MRVPKTPKTLWEKVEKTTTYNVVIVPMKKSHGKKIKKQTLSYIDIASLKPIVRKLLKQNSHREKSTM
jgi:hypothetical protein